MRTLEKKDQKICTRKNIDQEKNQKIVSYVLSTQINIDQEGKEDEGKEDKGLTEPEEKQIITRRIEKGL